VFGGNVWRSLRDSCTLATEMAAMRGKWRISAYIASIVVAIAPIPSTRAEILPTNGVFQGIYFQNRAGVGHFDFFIVSAELTKKLAPYNGKFVEIEVLRGIQ